MLGIALPLTDKRSKIISEFHMHMVLLAGCTPVCQDLTRISHQDYCEKQDSIVEIASAWISILAWAEQ